ncbi:MAG TPA: Maf family protein, partial [Gaiellaceae bacterium]|nr:Maf family protein [Gaiellaceae bacterium]
TEAEAMLERLAGRTHDVVSGLCLRTRAWEELHEATTHVTFRVLTPRDLGHYVGSGEWIGRAGGYAIQGLGASLVDRVDGDFLNVVGLPGSVLVRVLATRFAGVYGFG